jgi:GNAT superfamily N-acetyltransferase
VLARLLDAILAAVAGVLKALISGFFRAPATAAARAAAPIVVRRGTPAEVVDVRHRVLREGRPRETAIFAGDDAPDARHWVAVQADRVVGVASVMRKDMPHPAGEPVPRWQLRGMAVLPELRGEGLGARLLLAAHAEVAEPMWCNAREAVAPFYARHGWRAVGGVFDLPNVGPHLEMWWPGAP